MRKIEQTIYTYDELSDTVKERLLKETKEEEKQFYIDNVLEDDMKDKAQEILARYFDNNAMFKSVLYDLSYCQGSGAMIEFDVAIEDINNMAPDDFKLDENEIDIINSYCGMVNVKHYGHYYHERSFHFDWYNYSQFSDEWNEDNQTRLDNLLNNWFKMYVVMMNEELTKVGYDLVDYEPEEEFCIELLNQNEYFENGLIY